MPDLVNTLEGWCRLVFTNSTTITLQRQRGAYLPLKIGGSWQAKLIPSAGVTLSNAGLVAATLYFIYAYDNAGTLTLEASTTGHATDADTGHEIKSGDATRTLVGMVYMGAGSPGTFVQSLSQWFVQTWFQMRFVNRTGAFTANRTLTSQAAFTEINTEIRVEFVAWATQQVVFRASGSVSNDTAGKSSVTGISLDGAAPTQSIAMNTGVNGAQHGHSMTRRSSPGEGYHYITLQGKSAAVSTTTWYGTTNDGAWTLEVDLAVGV